MRKKLLSLLCCVAMVISCVGCGGAKADNAGAGNGGASNTPSGGTVTLVMAEVNPLDTIVGMTDKYFADKVKEYSNGSVGIDLQAAGVIGSENDVLDTMLAPGSTIDMSRISAFALTSYGGQKSMLLSLPYTFVSRDHFWKFATSDLAKEFLLEPSQNGLFTGTSAMLRRYSMNSG